MKRQFFHSNELANVRQYIDIRAGIIYINRAADPSAMTITIYG